MIARSSNNKDFRKVILLIDLIYYEGSTTCKHMCQYFEKLYMYELKT